MGRTVKVGTKDNSKHEREIIKRRSVEHLQKITLSALGRGEGSMAFNLLLGTNLGSCPFLCYKRKGGDTEREREASKKNHFL